MNVRARRGGGPENQEVAVKHETIVKFNEVSDDEFFGMIGLVIWNLERVRHGEGRARLEAAQNALAGVAGIVKNLEDMYERIEEDECC